jgi:hypothetical protein
MKEALKKFEVVKDVTCRNWDTLRKLVEEVSKDSTEILEIDDREHTYEWENKYNKESLSKIESWSTYENCYDLFFDYCDNKNIICSASVCDGNNFDGHRTNLRFIIKMRISIYFLIYLEKEIDWAFDKYLDREYDKYLERQKEAWINKKRNMLLKDK